MAINIPQAGKFAINMNVIMEKLMFYCNYTYYLFYYPLFSYFKTFERYNLNLDTAYISL